MRTIKLALSALLLLPIIAAADLIGLGDFSGSETVIDFTGISVPETSSPITVGDLTMDSSISNLVIGPDIFGVWAETPLASGGDHLANRNTAATDMKLSFATAVNRLGMWINGGNRATEWTFTAFDAGGDVIGSHIIAFNLVDGYPDPSTFAGIEFAAAFTSVTIVETINNGQYTNIDDIRFETFSVPEPGTLALLGIGLLGMAAARRRKNI